MKIHPGTMNRLTQTLGISLSLAAALWASPSARAQATHHADDWAHATSTFDNGDSLRDYLVRLRAALYLLKDNPQQNEPLTLSARVTAESRAGVRRLKIRNFQFLSDGPRTAGEFNLGAGSWPTVVGVLGSAVADSLEVIFTSTPGTAPSTTTGTQVTYPRHLAYTAFIVSPASDEQLEDLRKTVEYTSPVINLITTHQNIVAHGELVYTQTPAKREGKTLEGLREYLVEKRNASEGAIPAEGLPPRTARNEGEPPLRADVKVEGSTGVRNIRTDVSNFQIIHDNPYFLAGHNLGPVAEEHIIGVMITCLTHIYEIEASKLNVALDSLHLENQAVLQPRIGSIGNPPRYRSIAYKAYIGSPESRETIEKLQKAVESICPIYNLLKDSQPIQGTIVHGPYQKDVHVHEN